MPKKHSQSDIQFSCQVPTFLRQYQHYLGEDSVFERPQDNQEVDSNENQEKQTSMNPNSIDQAYDLNKETSYIFIKNLHILFRNIENKKIKNKKELSFLYNTNNDQIRNRSSKLSKQIESSSEQNTKPYIPDIKVDLNSLISSTTIKNEIKMKKKKDKHLITIGLHKQQNKNQIRSNLQKKKEIQNPSLLSFDIDEEE